MTRSLHGATGVFGGTFDPIHYAHLAVAEAAREALDLRRVLFIPAAQPPHKPDRSIAGAEHRFAMVQAAIADNPGFEISRVELDRGGPSYTVETLASLRAADAAEPLALILSAESFAELPTWHDPERILELARVVIVAPRFGYDEVDGSFLARNFPKSTAEVVLLDGPRVRLSASEIRERAAAGRSVRYLVPDAVAAYIGDHGLYQDQRRTDRS
ncbi:MAG TPA: nicotinate-nucleotide adenylyltransferase [Candidatus Limnocylindrales bacterium]|nr:nicotinate-nucleotide adenylyltransferase [Candidatus Limnocylindrales bacterium]